MYKILSTLLLLILTYGFPNGISLLSTNLKANCILEKQDVKKPNMSNSIVMEISCNEDFNQKRQTYLYNYIWGYNKNLYVISYGKTLWGFNQVIWKKIRDFRPSVVYNIWGINTRDLYVLGKNGRKELVVENFVAHYDGKKWAKLLTNKDYSYNGIWGVSKNSIYIVGSTETCKNIVLYFNGKYWKNIYYECINPTCKLMFSNILQGKRELISCFNSIWGTSDNNFYIAGDGGIINFNGSEYRIIYYNKDIVLYNIWGTSNDNIYTVGVDKTKRKLIILHYDGNSWSIAYTMDYNSSWLSGNIWGSSLDNIFVAASDVLLHYDGKSWRKLDFRQNFYFSVWGNSDNNIYIAGDYILRYDGKKWKRI